MIDVEDSRPPWVQLADILRAQIKSGEITGRVPSERTLHETYGLAPVTIRKAIRALRDEGLVETRDGWGTFIVKKDG